MLGFNRRQILHAGAAASGSLIVTGCVGAFTDDCGPVVSARQTLCHQQNIRVSAPLRLTAGMLIGAALGAGVALAFHQNPVVFAIGGAMLGTAAVAADAYIQYLTEQASGNAQLMAEMAQQDVGLDLRYASDTLDDSRNAVRRTELAVLNKNHSFASNAVEADANKQVLELIQKNRKTFQKAAEVYDVVDHKTVLLKTREAVTNLRSLGTTVHDIEFEEKRFFSLAG